jgi:periplasmic divalent cation tolerance protein
MRSSRARPAARPRASRPRRRCRACAQIVGPITSVYRWEGEVRTDTEWRVEVKTAVDRVAPLVELIQANHGYDVPKIILTPIDGGSSAYLTWLTAGTRS